MLSPDTRLDDEYCAGYVSRCSHGEFACRRRQPFRSGANAFSKSSKRGASLQPLAVDEEGRRHGHPELLGGAGCARPRCRRAASGPWRQSSKLAFVKSASLANAEQLRHAALATNAHSFWRANSTANSAKRLALAGAAPEHRGGRRQVVEREFAQHQAHLAGGDVLVACSLGSTLLWKAAQWGQVSEAYSTSGDGRLGIAEGRCPAAGRAASALRPRLAPGSCLCAAGRTLEPPKVQAAALPIAASEVSEQVRVGR